MSRPAAAELIEASRQPLVRPFMAAHLDYPDGAVRVCSLPQHITIDGDVYYGTGALGEISALTEGAENRSYGFTLALSGIPGNWAAYLRGQDVQGRLVTVRVGFVDAGYTVIGTEVVAVGRMDTQDIQVGARTAVVVACESIAVDWERARIRRFTDQDHRARYPADGFFKYIAAMENLDLKWGFA